ncbi:hypothetical protein D3C80_1225030 [compost metagenome]
MQPLQPGLGRAEAVVIGARTPAVDEVSVAKHLVAGEIGGEEAAELALQLRGDGRKEAGIRPLGQQIGLLAQALQQGGKAALLTHGKDEGEPLQVDQGKLEPELVPYFHSGVVDIGLHRIDLLSSMLPRRRLGNIRKNAAASQTLRGEM